VAALIDLGINLVVLGLIVLVLVVLGFSGLVLSAAGVQASGPAPDGQLSAGQQIAAQSMCCGICCGPFLIVLIANGVALVVGLFNKVWLVHKQGASVGQHFMKLRMVDSEGKNVPVGTLVLRVLVQFGLGLFPPIQLLNVLWPLWDAKRQALHDKAVGTFVLRIGA
jgi:uncharacterized RDD family membrane protein YckC